MLRCCRLVVCRRIHRFDHAGSYCRLYLPPPTQLLLTQPTRCSAASPHHCSVTRFLSLSLLIFFFFESIFTTPTHSLAEEEGKERGPAAAAATQPVLCSYIYHSLSLSLTHVHTYICVDVCAQVRFMSKLWKGKNLPEFFKIFQPPPPHSYVSAISTTREEERIEN